VTGGGIVEETPEAFRTEWFSVKKFMREFFGYNDLCAFLERISYMPKYEGDIMELSDSRGNAIDYRKPPWKNNPFYPILPESNNLLIKLPIDEYGDYFEPSSEPFSKLQYKLKRDPNFLDRCDCKHIIFHQTPAWSYWSSLEYWVIKEAAFLLFEEEPYENDEFFGKPSAPLDAIENLEDSIKRAFVARKIKGHIEDEEICLYSKSFIFWAKNQGFAIPADMKIPVVEDTIIEEGPKELSAKESRELGTLRNEKEEWGKSIEAAVYATHLFKGEKITRDKLWEALTKFDLPETTLEIVWKALRKEGLTKKAGRPKKTE
jgi:hypothetical protein